MTTLIGFHQTNVNFVFKWQNRQKRR